MCGAIGVGGKILYIKRQNKKYGVFWGRRKREKKSDQEGNGSVAALTHYIKCKRTAIFCEYLLYEESMCEPIIL